MSELPEDLAPYEGRLAEWIATYHYGHFVDAAEHLPLRRDMVTLLTYVQGHKITGTKATGNMPLKHIRAVTAQFVEPPELDAQVGEHVYRLRSEYDVWPLLLLHVLAEGSDLLITPPGARWQPTRAGQRFLEGDPLLQVLGLFSTWWYRVDWRIALPYGVKDLPEAFATATLALLLSQRINAWLPVTPFAHTLDKRTGLTEALHGSVSHDFREWDVHHLVIHRLAEFGVVEEQNHEIPIEDGHSIKRLEAFKITWFGKALMEGLSL